MAVGKILRFDDVRGYGFIAPLDGGEDVFVHANDFGERRHQVHPGMRVEYDVEQGDRGLKVASLRIIESRSSAAGEPSGVVAERRSATASNRDDDGMCDVLSSREFTAEITEILIQNVPTLTGAQISQIRQHLVTHARSRGWVDA